MLIYVKNPELKINIPIIKIVAKKTIDLIPTNQKLSNQKYQKNIELGLRIIIIIKY